MESQKNLLFIFLILSIAGFIVFFPFPFMENSPNDSVKVGFFPNITHSQALIGKTTGKFEKVLGKKIEWKKFNAGSSEIEALMAGEIDLGYIGPGPAINGYAKTRGELQIIAGATNAGAVLVSRKDLIIANIKQLSGRKIAIPQFGNTQDLALRYILKQNGLKDTTKGGTVEILQAASSDIKTLFIQKAIDAALVPEPWGARLIKETGANIILDYNKIWRNGNYPSAVLIVRTEFLKKNPDLVEKFLRTHIELTNYINKNNKEAQKLVNIEIKELTGKSLAQDVIEASFKRLKITNNPETVAVKELIELSTETGFLKKKPDTGKLFNLDILNDILKEKNKKKN